MRKVKSICKYLGYTLLYLIVCIGSAFGVITISMNNSAKQTTGSTETVVPKQISQIVDNLSNSENITTNLNVGLNSGESKIGIAIDAKINIGKNIDQISVDGNVIIDFDNTLYDIGITFKEGNLYFDVLGGKFRIETSNLINSVSKVMGLVGFEMPDLGGFDLENLNINELLGMLSDLTETKEKTQNILDIKVPMVDAMLKVITDKKYNLQTLSLPLFSINDSVSLELDGEFKYPESIIIDDKNNDDFVNLTTLIDVASDVLTLTKQNTLGIDALINYNGSSYGAFISADLENKNIMVETGYEGINAKLFFLDKSSIYLECGNIFAKFELKDVDKVTSLLERLGIKLPIDNISDLVNNVLNGNFDELKNSLNLGNFDLSKLKLDFLEKIEVVDNTTKIKIKDIGEISITSLDEGLENIRFNGFGIDASLNFKQSKTVELKQKTSDYADLALLIPVANNLIDFTSNNAFSGNVMVSNGEFEIPVNFTFIKTDSIFVKASTSLYGKQIDLTFDQNTLYLDLLGNKVKFNLNDADKILSEISTILGKDISLPEIDTNINEDTIAKIIEFVKDIINPEKVADLISLKENDGKLEIEVMGFKAIFETTPSSVKLNANYKDYSLTADIQAINDIAKDEIDETTYTDICNFIPIIENTLNMIKAREVNIEINGTYKDISVGGFANISNENIELKLDASYNAINANIILKDNVLYVKAQNINIKLDLNDLDSPAKFVKDNFNIDIPYLDEIKSIINSQNKVDDIISLITKNAIITTPQVDTTNINIEEILNNLTLEISDSLIKVVYGDLINASVNFANDNISSIALTYGEITGSLTFSDVPYTISVNENYVDAMLLTRYVEQAMKIVDDGHIKAITEIFFPDSGEKVNAFVQADFSSQIKLGVELSSNNIEGLDISFFVEEGILYFNYNGLLLKIDNKAFGEILSIALEFLGIDPSVIPFLDKIDLDFNLNEELGISTGVDLDPMKALNYIDYISGMEVNGNDLVISLNGKLLYGNDDAEDITITFTSTGERLTGIKLGNVYNLNRTRQIDASLTIQEWTGYTGVDKTKNYIDISCASDLIKGLVNMVATKDFHIAGTFNVNGKMAGIDLASAVKALGKNNVIPFDIKIKVVDKKPEIAIVLGEIPAVVGVNNDVPYEFGDTESGDNRFLYIYYKDDAIYIYRSETVDIMFGAGKRSYEKATKISLDRLLEDPMYYVQYSLGFTEDIINAMKDSMQLASNRTTPMDYSNILRPIEVVDSNSYRVKINMAEVSNNPQLGIMSILFRIGQDRNGKNYVDHLEFGLDLPLKEDTVNLKLDSSNIDVKNYLDEVDMSALYDYVNKYSYNFDEEWEASKGKWSKSSEKIYTIKFNSNGGQNVGDITGCYKTPLSLPTLPDIVTDNGAYKSTKVFAGWFTDQNLAEETRSSLTTMPRHDTTLYAKWDETIVYYRTIKFVTNSKFTCDDITKLSGSEITLFILEDKEETQGNTTSYYHFVGWYTDESLSEENAFNESIMPDYDVTLYAKWELYKEETTANFKLYHNDDLLIDKQVKVGDKIDITNALVKENTKFYYNKDFNGETYEGNFEIIEDTTLYLRNKYHFTITSDHGTKINSEFDLYEGEAMPTLASQESEIVEDDGNTRVVYAFRGYSENLTIAPDKNTNIVANWEVIETKYYYTISFDISFYVPTGWVSQGILTDSSYPADIAPVKLLEGTTLNLNQSQFKRTMHRKYTKISSTKTFNIVGWAEDKPFDCSAEKGFLSYTVTGNKTLYACWKM